MLGKVLVGLIAVAAIAVGGYYYFDADSTGIGCGGGGSRPCARPLDTAVAAPASCTSEPVEACCAVEELATGTTGPETLTAEPRTVQVEVGPQPRELSTR